MPMRVGRMSVLSRRRFAAALTGGAALQLLGSACSAPSPTPPPATAVPAKPGPEGTPAPKPAAAAPTTAPTTAPPAPTTAAVPTAAATAATAPPAGAAGAASPTGAPAAKPSGFNWKAQTGSKISALFTNNPQGDYLKTRVPAFEEATGIKVDFQILEPGAMRNKQNVEFAAGASSIDVWHTFTNQEGVKYARAGWYEPIKPYLDNPALTPSDYDLADFGALRLGEVNGTLVGIPMWTEVQPLYVNKELTQQGGVELPKTMDQLEAAAKKLHAPDKGVYGWSTRATSFLNTSAFTNVFFSHGAKWLTADGKANLTSPEAVAALDWYGRMLRLYGPPSPDTLDLTRASDLFKAGKVAFFLDSPSFIGPFLDKEKSAVAGKFDIAVWPAGPAGSKPSLGTWNMTVGKFSKSKPAAWTFVAYNTTKEAGLGFARGSGIPPARKSVLELPEYKELIAKTVPALPEILKHGLANGETQWYPPVSVAEEGRQLLGDAIVAAIQGKEAKQVADEANRKFQATLDKEK
jgi:multiple sugar transport system substrate-binding protein